MSGPEGKEEWEDDSVSREGQRRGTYHAGVARQALKIVAEAADAQRQHVVGFHRHDGRPARAHLMHVGKTRAGDVRIHVSKQWYKKKKKKERDHSPLRRPTRSL